KARVAVLFGYCGSGYKGSQLNPGMPTIEAELMKAFVAAGAITAENNDPKKVGLNRCARTDKGVHAAGNVISLKLRIIPNLVQAINAHLPKQIRIYDCLRVTSSFNAKNHCGGRQYEYCMPTYMLRKSCKSRYPYSNLPDPATVQTDKKEHEESCEMGGTSWVVVDKSESYEELIKFRVADTELEHLREVLKGYEGTHNFHNFTVGVKFNQKNSGRYITSFAAADPFIRSDGTQWIRLFVNGQSFMLHQIRKMVSFAVMAVRTGTPATVVAATYGEEKLNVPKAPALGLLLRKPLFEAYNRQQQKLHADRAPLEFGPYENIIEPFLDEWVQPDMYAEEHERHIYAGWLERVDAH
ncbi:pseudouridine synthase, partial [Chytriomyces sp. MP71]